ncbi:MAG TPA: hypothetical protein VKR57_08895 [Terriglobales bacterium]|nr:hypothetical protein [Terriglobales bacterium]
MNLDAEAHPQPAASYLHGEGITFVPHDGDALFVFFWLIPSSVSTLVELSVRFPNPTAAVDEPVAEKNTVTFPRANAELIADQAPLSDRDCQGDDGFPLRVAPAKAGST